MLKSNLTPDAVPLIILLDFQLVMVDVFVIPLQIAEWLITEAQIKH